MPRTNISVSDPKGPYPGTVAANDLDVSFTTADVVNGNEFTFTGRELILIKNAHATLAKWATITSVVDPQNRLGDITQYSLGAGELAHFWAGNVTGWNQAGGKFYISGESTDIQFAIYKIPK